MGVFKTFETIEMPKEYEDELKLQISKSKSKFNFCIFLNDSDGVGAAPLENDNDDKVRQYMFDNDLVICIHAEGIVTLTKEDLDFIKFCKDYPGNSEEKRIIYSAIDYQKTSDNKIIH